MLKFLALEVVCILFVALGLALWFEVGVGLVAVGLFGLPLVVASEYVARRSRRSG